MLIQNMLGWAWRTFGEWLTRNEKRVDYLIERAMETPYFNLDGYMNRWWLLKPSSFLPFSIRIHHILRRDNDRAPHNHPWAFRTIILHGWYDECLTQADGSESVTRMLPGMTQARSTSDYHRITEVSEGGVWTLFIMRRKSGEWGFASKGGFVHWTEYHGECSDGN